MDIPKVKPFPADAIQCNRCGGHGCANCFDRGWVTSMDPTGRRCYREVCENPILPDHVAVYCSNECAFEDA